VPLLFKVYFFQDGKRGDNIFEPRIFPPLQGISLVMAGRSSAAPGIAALAWQASVHRSQQL